MTHLTTVLARAVARLIGKMSQQPHWEDESAASLGR